MNETAPEPRHYTIGQLAAACGVTPRTIRFYEDCRLLAPRRLGHNRIYRPRDRARLELILRGRRLGFALADIADMLALFDLGAHDGPRMRLALHKARARIAELERQAVETDTALRELRAQSNLVRARLIELGLNPDEPLTAEEREMAAARRPRPARLRRRKGLRRAEPEEADETGADESGAEAGEPIVVTFKIEHPDPDFRPPPSDTPPVSFPIEITPEFRRHMRKEEKRRRREKAEDEGKGKGGGKRGREKGKGKGEGVGRAPARPPRSPRSDSSGVSLLVRSRVVTGDRSMSAF